MSLFEQMLQVPELVSPKSEPLVTPDKIKENMGCFSGTRQAVVSLSGGSDSDIMLDIIQRALKEDKPWNAPIYVFFDTGLEYAATHKHLDDLEQKYGIKIERFRAVKPIPAACKEYGVPFLTKRVSKDIKRLQKVGFEWADEPYEKLLEKYPRTKSELKWWCNAEREGSDFNISKFPWLKEFMIANPPDFKISDECCNYAKKLTAKKCIKHYDADLDVTGMRQAEGGIRALSIKSCWSDATDKNIARFRPLFFWSDADKAAYKEAFGITYSDAYEVYGYKRTGCAGCPFNSKFDRDLQVMQIYEPKLYKAAINIFGKSYDYTRKFRAYQAQRKMQAREELRQVDGQMRITPER